ncbi:MAG: hypothetical protein NXI18_15415 [Alphaproteobacteria bacterium]|nr:hypothetical protein [Alphaproteobacteria bacterium]
MATMGTTMAARTALLLIAGVMLLSCASAPTQSRAQETGAPASGLGFETGPLSVMVLGEDAHPSLLPRDDPAFRRVVSELQAAMDRRGFRVVDAAAVAAELGWKSGGTGDRVDALEAARLANASGSAATRVQAVVLFRIESIYRDLRYTTRIDLTLSGEIYDVRSNRFLGAFDLPTETVSTAGSCVTSTCASNAVGGRARDLAVDLGAVLARRLAYLAPPAGTVTGGKRLHESVYTVTFRQLSTEDALSIIGVMTDGFPGYRSHDLMRGGVALRRYQYVSTASVAEIERWLTLLLVDMDLDPQRQVFLGVRGSDIWIERLTPGGARSVD